jgi:hypothetical protein
LKCKSFGSLLAASWKQFTLIIMNHETYESRNFQVDTTDNLVHIIIFVTKWSTRLHHWTEDSTILITVVLYVRFNFCHIFFVSIVMFEYAAFVVF